MSRQVVIGQLRVQKLTRRDGRRSWTIVWPEGTVHTEADRQRIIRIGVPRSRIHLIRHPVPPALPLPDAATVRRIWAREHPQLEGRRFITLFGFLSAKKGHRIALAALSRLPDDIALLFAGDRHPDDNTGYVASLRDEIAQLRTDRRTGAVDRRGELNEPA